MDNPQLVPEQDDPKNRRCGLEEIFLEAAPFGAGRLDASGLWENEGAALAAWEGLLDRGGLELTAAAPPGSENLFFHWYQESRNQERIWGRRPLAFGFPLCVFRQNGRFGAAPLLLWEASIEPAPHRSALWRLTHRPGQWVAINERLLELFAGRLEPALINRLRGLPQRRPPGGKELAAGLEALTRALEWEEFKGPLGPAACPPMAVLEQRADPGAVLPVGVLALFPQQETAGDNNPGEWLQPEESRAPGHSLGRLQLNPHQATAFQAIRNHSLVTVAGPVGAGKTHLLVHLLTNSLSNGQNCLVVSPAIGDLRDVFERLSRFGGGPLCFLATDAERAGGLLQEMLRAQAELSPPPPAFDPAAFQQSFAKWDRDQQKLDESYRALRRVVFGEYNWTETVGLFLNSNRMEGKELLAGQLSGHDFRLRYDEYLELREIVLHSQSLYRKVNVLRHPLQNLHSAIFLEFGREEARAFLNDRLAVFSQKLSRLHKQYIGKINDYSDLLAEHYDQWYEEMARQVEQLLEKMEDNLQRFGRDFVLASRTSLRLYGAVIPRYKETLRAREDILADYRSLAQSFSRLAYFDFTFPPAGEGRSFSQVRPALEAFRQSLQSWREQAPSLSQEAVTRLSHQAVHPQINYQGHILQLEESLDLLLAELNAAGIYEQPFENRMLTIPKRRRYLEEVMEQLENTRLFLRDFDGYYDWRRHWLQLSESARQLVRALAKVKPADWLAAFESWYLNNCLTQAYDPALPSKALNLRQFVFNRRQLQEQLDGQISHRWAEKRQQIHREMKRQQRREYQHLTGRRKGTEEAGLFGLLERLGDSAVRLFPVWLITPELAAQLPLPAGAFDLVVVEQAQLLSPDRAAAALRLGKRRALLANPGLAPLGPRPSLWDAARASGAPGVELPSSRCQDDGGLPAPFSPPASGPEEKDKALQTSLRWVGGMYNEAEETNEEEARQVIRLLREIEKKPQRTFPFVAIATLTRSQRDCIARQIFEIRREETVQQLERNGLGVFCADELIGLHPDVLILSAAFGPNEAKNLTSHLRRLNSPESLAHLALLFSVPRRETHIIHSISGADLKILAATPADRGTFLLANYLEYMNGLHQNDPDLQQEVSDRLLRQGPPPPGRSEHPFVREVALALQSFIPAARIHSQIRENRLRLPLKIDSVSGQASPFVLAPDGFFAETAVTDYGWELSQWEYLTERGYTLYPVWSVNWWRNPQLESRRLISAIISHGEGEAAANR